MLDRVFRRLLARGARDVTRTAASRKLRLEPLENRALLSATPVDLWTDDGQIAMGIADSPPPSEDFVASAAGAADAPESAVILSEVPTSRWTYGCGATAVGMLFGYYDRVGYDNMYTGPTNGGVAPLTDLGQGSDPASPITSSCSIIASQNGFDGRTTAGHVDDYWIASGASGPDPWEAGGIEHAWGDCVADFLGTNQWKWDTDRDGTVNANEDGSTRFYYNTNGSKMYDPMPAEDLGYPRNTLSHGMRMFAESKGYFVATNYNQLTNNEHSNGFTFAEYTRQLHKSIDVILTKGGETRCFPV
ncbi:MAG: hypothetical protein GXX96_05065 [Planctomycetaceae bacterium]|nr:hypothetical protein [Planctomycetaceae bacterium]